MPQRLENFYSNLNKQNMRRRLFYIYKWMVGRRNANRDDYANWLEDLATWFEQYSGYDSTQGPRLNRRSKYSKNSDKKDKSDEDDDKTETEKKPGQEAPEAAEDAKNTAKGATEDSEVGADEEGEDTAEDQ